MNDASLTIADEFYRIQNWGDRYFSVNSQGNVTVRPDGNGHEGDLYKLVHSLSERGIEAPILIRFDGIIRDRIRRLQSAFDAAIQEFNYRNTYSMAYPVKVNPQRHVVEQLQKLGSKFKLGLEVGSKPELLAVLTLDENPHAFILCNGYKDAEYIEIALLANKLGIRTIIVIEQVYEVKLILDVAKRLGIEAEVGFRYRPTNKGTGRWKTSGGDFAKFGLDSQEMIACMDQLKQAGKESWLKLFHFHIGSQITSIEAIKKALQEAACMYVELAKLCPSLSFFDAGGGLGVDYDGSQTMTDSSMNYSVEEYARDVVSAIGEACLQANLPDPTIITESGRALSAHHSILVTEVIDVASHDNENVEIEAPATNNLIQNDFFKLYQKVTPKNALESLHDATQLKEEIVNSFIHGKLSLHERAYCEKLYQQTIAKIISNAQKLKEIPEEIETLANSRRDMYFCNFSVFQSLPDAWAIQQLFPIMPIHRLNEKPTKNGIIADLSCDSDGKIDQFIGHRGVPNQSLTLHEMGKDPYYVGIFMVGAYQEILGGLHNLFGDTNAVHVELHEDGSWEINNIVEGDTIEEVLQYTQYHPAKLLENLHGLIENSRRAGRISPSESGVIQKKIKQFLESYTYLVV